MMANNASSALDWINQLDTCIFGLDIMGHVTVWNHAMEALSGFAADEVINQPLSTVWSDDDVTVQKILQCNPSEHYCVTVSTKTRKAMTLKLKLSAQRNRETGESVGVVCFVEEVPLTNGNSGLGSLKNGHVEANNSFVDEANALVFGVDHDGIVNLWNETSAQVLGYTKEEATGKGLLEFLETDPRVSALLRCAMKGTTENSARKVELWTKSGEIRIVLLSFSRQPHGVLFVAQDISDCDEQDRTMEGMLHEMIHELRSLIDGSNVPMFGVDTEGDVNEWNERMTQTTGFSKEDAFDQNFVTTFVVPSLQQSVQEIVDNGLRGHGTSNFEFEFRTIDGDIRYLLVNASTRRDISGHIVGIICVAEDVTEAAQHDRAVAAMARELRQLVDTANAPIFGIDVDGNVNEWNDKTADITGFTGDEAFNRPLVDTFIVPKLRTPVQEVLDNALKGRGTASYELEFRTKSNEIRYLLVNATTRRDAENNIVGVVCVSQDVTEAAKHDRAVAAMANELRQLIDTANAPIFGIDIDGDVNEWNDKTAEITGYTKEEAFDCNLIETFIVPSLRESVQVVMDNALQGRGTSNYELEFRTKSNEIRHLLVNATTRRDAENRVVGVVGVAQDVTEAVHRDRAVVGMASELRQLIETANAPIFGIDVDGNVNEWNKKTAEITGYLKDEAFDEPLVAKFIAPPMRKQVQDVMVKALAGNETSNYELEIVSKSGEVRVLLVNATTRRDPDSNVVGGKLTCFHSYWIHK